MSTNVSGSDNETAEVCQLITSDESDIQQIINEDESAGDEGCRFDTDDDETSSITRPLYVKYAEQDVNLYDKPPAYFLKKDFEWDVQPPVLEYEDYLQVNDLGKRFVSRVCNEIEARINILEHVDDGNCMCSNCAKQICCSEEQSISFAQCASFEEIRCSEYQKEKGIICSDDCICTVPVARETDLTCLSESCICQEPFKTICWDKNCACVECENLASDADVWSVAVPCVLNDCAVLCAEQTTCKCVICNDAMCLVPCNMEDCACLFCPGDLVLVAPENECVCDKLLNSKHPCSCWLCPFESDMDFNATCLCYKEYDPFTVKNLDYKTKPSFTLMKAVLTWPLIENFSVRQMQRHVELFVLMWDLNPAWMFCTNLARTIEKIGSTTYMYEVVFSFPTYKYPVPQATAAVYFVVDISYIIPPETPIKVHYQFEGQRYSYTPSPSVSFQEYILSSIINSKIEIYRRLGMYNL